MRRLQLVGPPLSGGATIFILALAGVAIPLAAAQDLELTSRQTGAWIFSLYIVPGLLSVLFAFVSRQPLLFAWNVSLPAFFASLHDEMTYPELLGAALVGGMLVLLLGGLGLTERLARLVPTPVVLGVLAGALLPFVTRAFGALDDEPLIVGGALAAYLLSRRFGGPKLPPVLPAMVAGVVLAAASGELGSLPGGWAAPPLELTRPAFELPSVLAVAPVFAALIALQSNLPALLYLRSQGYTPPTRPLEGVTGATSALATPLGPTPVCVAALLVPLAAGPEGGERELRYWAAVASGVALALVALGAGMAAELPRVLPLPLLAALAGLAVISILGQALGEVTKGPLRVGPLFAFAVAASDLSLLGLGPLFWALVVGTGVSLLLEADAMREVRAG